jgi:DNA-binding MarR family transcriptional regulator
MGDDVNELFVARGLGFLLSQVGTLSSRRWAERLAELRLDTRQVMLFWNIALSEGRSQRELAQALLLPSSRIVGLVDALEERGWVKRRTNTGDRRARALYLTTAGREALARILVVAAEHETEMSKGIDAEQRDMLVKLLETIVSAQGLSRGVHPGF